MPSFGVVPRTRKLGCSGMEQVVFSDESRFNLSSDDNRVRVLRLRGERHNAAFALQRHTAPTADGMIWGAIAFNTRSPLVLIRGTMAAQRIHFSTRQCSAHTARVSQDGLRTVTTLPWLARSTDLSPIEHIWDYLGQRVGHPTCLNELDARLQQIWNEMSQALIQNFSSVNPTPLNHADTQRDNHPRGDYHNVNLSTFERDMQWRNVHPATPAPRGGRTVGAPKPERYRLPDEAWLYYYDLTIKQQNSKWKLSSSPTPKNAKTGKSAGKMLGELYIRKMKLICYFILWLFVQVSNGNISQHKKNTLDKMLKNYEASVRPFMSGTSDFPTKVSVNVFITDLFDISDVRMVIVACISKQVFSSFIACVGSKTDRILD
ncbi:transposable element Tcb2 transposase [Trichonephila clavipes]|nr:transposable element Tcb2 transposase [Trichonephila clavipes]